MIGTSRAVRLVWEQVFSARDENLKCPNDDYAADLLTWQYILFLVHREQVREQEYLDKHPQPPMMRRVSSEETIKI